MEIKIVCVFFLEGSRFPESLLLPLHVGLVRKLFR